MELPSKVLRTNYYSVLFIFAGHNLSNDLYIRLYLLYKFNYSDIFSLSRDAISYSARESIYKTQ